MLTYFFHRKPLPSRVKRELIESEVKDQVSMLSVKHSMLMKLVLDYQIKVLAIPLICHVTHVVITLDLRFWIFSASNSTFDSPVFLNVGYSSGRMARK